MELVKESWPLSWSSLLELRNHRRVEIEQESQTSCWTSSSNRVHVHFEISLGLARSEGIWLGPSRLALQTPPWSPSNSSSFQISTFSLHISSASSPAVQAGCRCGAETAMSMLSSATGTTPSRCPMVIAVRACFCFMVWAIESIVFRARGG